MAHQNETAKHCMLTQDTNVKGTSEVYLNNWGWYIIANIQHEEWVSGVKGTFTHKSPWLTGFYIWMNGNFKLFSCHQKKCWFLRLIIKYSIICCTYSLVKSLFCPNLSSNDSSVWRAVVETCVKFHGACTGCSVNQMTLKNGVEATIKKYAPQVQKVVEVK